MCVLHHNNSVNAAQKILTFLCSVYMGLELSKKMNLIRKETLMSLTSFTQTQIK